MEIKDLFDIPISGRKIANAGFSGLLEDEISEEVRIKLLEKIRRHTVFDEAHHIHPPLERVQRVHKEMMGNEFPSVGTPGHIDHPHFLVDSLADLEYPLFIPNTPLNTKAFTPLITLPEDLDEWKTKSEPTSKQISDQRNSAKKRDKKKVKAQRLARKLNRR